MAQLPGVERKPAHWNHKGGRQSRYHGLQKTRLQALWSAALVNIERLMVIGRALDGLRARHGGRIYRLTDLSIELPTAP
jgi:hypothetical protein